MYILYYLSTICIEPQTPLNFPIIFAQAPTIKAAARSAKRQRDKEEEPHQTALR